MPLKCREQEAPPRPRGGAAARAPSSLSFLFHCGLALATRLQPGSLPGSGIPAPGASVSVLTAGLGCRIHHQISEEPTLRKMHKNQYHPHKHIINSLNAEWKQRACSQSIKFLGARTHIRLHADLLELHNAKHKPLLGETEMQINGERDHTSGLRLKA